MDNFTPAPIGAIVQYCGTNTVQLLRSGQPVIGIQPRRKKGERKKITHLTRRSLSRLIFLTQVSQVRFRSMLTVTYLCPPADGRKAKADLRCVLQWLGRQEENAKEYIWFCEFTGAGSIHYHIITQISVTEEKRIQWARYWSKRTAKKLGPYCTLRTHRQLDPEMAVFEVNVHEKTWENLRSEDGAKRYIAKYAGKPHQKIVPSWFADIGRFWGVSQGVRDSVKVKDVRAIDEDELRELLIEQSHRLASVDILPRYIWGLDL